MAASATLYGMDNLQIHCDVTGTESVLRLSGSLAARHCALLAEALDMAWAMRPDRPLVIDLAEVSEYGILARSYLARFVRDADRAQRTILVQNSPPGAAPILKAYRPMRTSLPRLENRPTPETMCA